MGLNKYRILLVLDDSLSFFKILESTYSKKRHNDTMFVLGDNFFIR